MPTIRPREGYYGRQPGVEARLRTDDHWSVDRLTGLWLMNAGFGSRVRDFGPFARHGLLTDMDSATDWVLGPNGWALDFDGANDVVVMSNPMASWGADGITILAGIAPDTGTDYD